MQITKSKFRVGNRLTDVHFVQNKHYSYLCCHKRTGVCDPVIRFLVQNAALSKAIFNYLWVAFHVVVKFDIHVPFPLNFWAKNNIIRKTSIGHIDNDTISYVSTSRSGIFVAYTTYHVWRCTDLVVSFLRTCMVSQYLNDITKLMQHACKGKLCGMIGW